LYRLFKKFIIGMISYRKGEKMDKRVYLLTIVSFVVGMVELIIGGILHLVAGDLNVSIGEAGLLITIFSLTFAIAAPILVTATAGIERKKLTIISLVIFLIGNLVAVFSPTYSILFLSRIISAASSSLLMVLCVSMASDIAQPEYRGRAVGIVNMGVSASLVFGIPIGLILGNMFGWRAPFILITILTVISIICVSIFLDRFSPRPAPPIKKQIDALKNRKISFALLTTFIFMSGHTILYAYLTPNSQATMGLEAIWISVVYLIFGAAAVSGGAIGGNMSDRIGPKPTIIAFIITMVVSLFIIPFTTAVIPLFLLLLIVWGSMSWAITPPMQSYLMETSPETADVLISLNNSALHFGIAFGSLLGGLVINQISITVNPFVGGLIVLLSLGSVFISFKGFSRQKNKIKVHD